ncbi:hypothetical protein J4Q44_G00255320 [Coregonus suidteri]|uniref:Uncharacterized protein n=1 Tax=Coregonus suidteri TaxID=861788 RepID=A0AAN8QMA2_9TELE
MHHLCFNWTVKNKVSGTAQKCPYPDGVTKAFPNRPANFLCCYFTVGTNMQYLQQEKMQEPFVRQLKDKLHYSQPCVIFNVIALLEFLKLQCICIVL